MPAPQASSADDEARRREWFGALVEVLPDEVFVFDAKTLRCLHANATAQASLGPAAHRLHELTPLELTPSLTAPAMASYLEQLESGTATVVFEGVRPGRAPSQEEGPPVEVRWHRLSAPHEPVILSIVHDISDRKQVERVKDEFISIVSHELRTPLTAVHGAVRLLEGGAAGPLAPQAAQLVAVAAHSTERLRHIVDDILDLEKTASGRMDFDLQPVEAAPLLQRIAQSYAVVGAPAGVPLEVQAPTGLRLRADPARLAQVVGNLVSNALKYAPPSTPVQLVARPEQAAEGGGVRIEVLDQGPGVPVAFAGRIFQRFAQADMNTTRQKGGSGLGLSIVKAMVEGMGGRVGFESAPGRTCFWLALPAAG